MPSPLTLPPSRTEPNGELMGVGTVARMFGKTHPTIRSYGLRGLLPYRVIDGRMFFGRDDCVKLFGKGQARSA